MRDEIETRMEIWEERKGWDGLTILRFVIVYFQRVHALMTKYLKRWSK